MNSYLNLSLVALLFLTISCSSEKPKGKTEAEILYKEAMSLMEDGSYLLATDKINQLKNQYPYSFYATPAELLQADILFKQENYVEAAAAYLLFRDFHPKHDRIDYVVFQIGNSYYLQIPDTFDRDLQAAVQSIKYFNELLVAYPTSKHTKEVNEKIDHAKKMLLEKERYVADFYYRTEVYKAARWRYLDILENFSDKDLRNHSMKKIVETSYLIKDYKGCLDFSLRYKDVLTKDDYNSLEEIIDECKAKINEPGEKVET